jgi:murein L,D-transpeptidase YcbB/YkuD
MVSRRVNGLAAIVMAMSANKLALGFCVASALFLSVANADVALADKDDRTTTLTPQPLSTIPPSASVQAPAVAGIDLAVERLEQSGRLTGLAVDWPGVKSYYAAGGVPLWTVPEGYSVTGAGLVNQLRRAIAAGMPSTPQLQELANTLPAQLTPAQVADGEALLSALYTASAFDATSNIGRHYGQGATLLTELRNAKDQPRVVGQQLPSFHMFWRLYAVLPAYVRLYEQGGWPTVSGTDKLEPGDKNLRVRQVKERLLVTGELGELGDDPELYDTRLEVAMKLFQHAHGLNDDGVIGKRTIEEMNVSAEQRVKMLLLNLDRMREQSPDFEDRYLFVNIPSTELRIIDNGVTTYFANAIVGKVARKTPTLKSEVFQVKLNPDWSVPAKIAKIDMLKHELDEPGYFASKNVRVYDSSNREIDPRSIDWREVKASGHFPYRLKQDSGPENALGPMKLDFQNDYAVFVHGTSTPKLFAKQDRFFSSGCVRVDDPLGLATFLLQDDPSWNRDRVDAVVKSGKITYAKLARPIPLHFVYMTAWVDEGGVANFRNDVYKKDPGVTIPAALRGQTQIAQQDAPAANGAAAASSGAPLRQGSTK